MDFRLTNNQYPIIFGYNRINLIVYRLSSYRLFTLSKCVCILYNTWFTCTLVKSVSARIKYWVSGTLVFAASQQLVLQVSPSLPKMPGKLLIRHKGLRAKIGSFWYIFQICSCNPSISCKSLTVEHGSLRVKHRTRLAGLGKCKNVC